jgi:hypothetical protein
MSGMSRVRFWRKGGRLVPAAGIGAALALGLWTITAVAAPGAWAQSPGSTWFMEDFPPGGAYPNHIGKVVEGLGLGSCLYSVLRVETATVASLNRSYFTVTEISPQSYCVASGIAGYEARIHSIYRYVETHTSHAPKDWAGFMLDEEPGFGFSAAQLEVLNRYVASLMNPSPGVSWYFTENQPNGWYLATYNAIAEGSWLAPQVYSSSMAGAVNAECRTYGKCMNDVTVDGVGFYPWYSSRYVTGLIIGSAWHVAAWGSTRRFCNLWVPV